MPRLNQRHQRRRAATTVETAIVLLIFFLFVFGIFEYARFLFFLEVAENAAREGARYATVNTGRSVSVGTKNDAAATLSSTTLGSGNTKKYFDSDAGTPPTICAVVNYFMKGRQGNLTSYNLNVYASNSSGASVGTWTNAPFGSAIAVQITGKYTFEAAQLLGFSGTIPIDIKVMMNSEAN